MTLRQASRDAAASIIAALAEDPGVFNLVPGRVYVGGWIVEYEAGFLGLFSSSLPDPDELDQVAIAANDQVFAELAAARAELGLAPGQLAKPPAKAATAIAFLNLGGVRWWVLDGDRVMFFLSIELEPDTGLKGMATETTLAKAFDPVADLLEDGGSVESSFLLGGIEALGGISVASSADVTLPLPPFALGLAGFVLPDSLLDPLLPDVELDREDLEDANERTDFLTNPFVLGGIGTAILVAVGVGVGLVVLGPRLFTRT